LFANRAELSTEIKDDGVPQLSERLQDDWRRRSMEVAVAAQELERAGAAEFTRKCVFCQEDFVGRGLLFRHMLEVHSFNCGNPENLVGTAELLDAVEARLARLECPRCEKTFTNPEVLRMHMRKKKHFAINPANRSWDRFWLVNFGAGGGGGEGSPETSKTEAGAGSDDDAEGWSDWDEGGEEGRTVCLFCPLATPTPALCLTHMIEAHGFDLEAAWESLRTPLPEAAMSAAAEEEADRHLYRGIRLVNLIRQRMVVGQCLACEYQGPQVVEHMRREGHMEVPLAVLLQQEEREAAGEIYLLQPVLEGDLLLTIVG